MGIADVRAESIMLSRFAVSLLLEFTAIGVYKCYLLEARVIIA